jgi:hypothetical protein
MWSIFDPLNPKSLLLDKLPVLKSMCRCDPNGRHPSNVASDTSVPSVSDVVVSFSIICVVRRRRFRHTECMMAADVADPGMEG